MTVAAILDDLRQRGIRLSADGDDIHVRAPKGTLTPEVLELVRARKPELLTVLAQKNEASDEAKVLLNELLAIGCTFQVISADNDETLIWFGPASAVMPETRYRIARLKPRLIALLKKMRRASRREWGEPTPEDWRQHPGWDGSDNDRSPSSG